MFRSLFQGEYDISRGLLELHENFFVVPADDCLIVDLNDFVAIFNFSVMMSRGVVLDVGDTEMR